jgi:hypothetical protein
MSPPAKPASLEAAEKQRSEPSPRCFFMRVLAARLSIQWRPWRPGTWAGWGRDRIVSARRAGAMTGSFKYWLGLGPLLVWVIFPMTRRQIEMERRLIEPALRRINRRQKRLERRRS